MLVIVIMLELEYPPELKIENSRQMEKNKEKGLKTILFRPVN